MKPSSFRAPAAIVWRDFSIMRSYRGAFVLDVFFGIMNLILFYFISRTVAPTEDLDGATTYFAFASVGIILTVVMQSATNGLARRVREEQLTGTLEILVMQPIGAIQLAFGLTGFPSLFGLARGVLYIAVAATFLDLELGNADLLGVGLILAGAALALSAMGIALGAIVLVFKQGEVLVGIVTFGLSLLSGALFPRTLLPGWLQTVGDGLPTRFALDGLRNALFGGGWGTHFIALVVACLVLMPLALWFFSGLLRAVKMAGSLSQY